MIRTINWKNCSKYDVIDEVSGARIPLVQRVDTKKNLVDIVLYDYANQKWIVDKKGMLVIFQLKRKIKLIKK